jgi:galactokinase
MTASVSWAAPGRVNLIGEHTDYNDGFVLPFALPHRTTVRATLRPDRSWTASTTLAAGRVEFDLSTKVDGWAAYVAAVVWALRDAGHDVPGADLEISSDVPRGAGLSSSAALESAVLCALAELGELDLPLERRPALAQRAENEYVGVPCGIMDQSASLLCQEGHALFLDCRSLAVEQVPFDLAAQGLAILITDTRAEHELASGEYAARRSSCEQAAAQLGVPALRDATLADLSRLDDELLIRRARHVISENDRVLETMAALRAGESRKIGQLMTRSHESLRDDFEVSAPELDTVVEAALAAGAHGARMTGGGFGGSAIALVDSDAVDRVSASIAARFAERGFRPPVGFVALPSAGAIRLS